MVVSLAPRSSSWRPDDAGLPRRRLTVGLLTYGPNDPNSRAIWAGVAATAQAHDLNLIAFPGNPLRSPLEFEAQSNVLYDLVGASNVDGLVIWLAGLSHQVDPQEVKTFWQRYRPLPMVTVGMLAESIPGVIVDNYGGMRSVVEHLIVAHGYRRIAFIKGPEYHEEAKERYRAYCDVLAEHGLPCDPDLIVGGNFKESGGLAAVDVLLDERQVRFDALLGASDNMAIGALKALQARGVRVPENLAIAGLNDESQGAFMTPPLTTGALRFYEQAVEATTMLLRLLRGETVPERVILPAQTLIRQSCGCRDPLVARAAKGPSRPGNLPLEVALQAEHAALLAETARFPALVVGSGATELAERLLGGLSGEIVDRVHGAFLEALSDVLRQSDAVGLPVIAWQDAISALRRVIAGWPAAGTVREQVEDLWQQARVMIGSAAQRGQAYQVLQAEAQARTLGRVAQMLSTPVHCQELADAVAAALPQLGIPSCYLSLYENPALPADKARLMAAYDRQGRIELPDGGQVFPACGLVPAGLLAPDQRYSLVVEPLYFRHEQLGIVVLEAEPRKDEVYEVLRDQISGALQRTRLVAHNLELYDLAVKAREVAEDGRRLAEKANHLKSRFLATVSHELRTPLSLIVGTIEMIQHEERTSGQALPPLYRRDLSSIRTSAQHLAHLIGDVLDLASSQAGELRLVRAPLQVGDLLARAAALAEPMARERGLTFRTDIPDDLPLVYGDRTRLQQVVLNLVSNAIKFTEQGTVTLWAEVGREEVMVAVSDTGMGIPPAEQETIFSEFRQSERATSRGYGGMGLGLAISRHLVELHGGRIGVLSTGADGAGSTFHFTLPRLPRPDADLRQVEECAGQVLLLTEHLEDSGRLRAYLASRGFEVAALATAGHPDWLNQVVAASPGAVVLDFEPAAERGWELMQMLKLNSATCDIPVLFCALPEGQANGAVLALDYLTKPLAEDRLAGALDRQGMANGTCRGQVILIVDDDPAILDLHTRMVQSHVPGCQVLRAGNGAEALAAMARQRPDLVLLDLMMPVMDGFAFLQAMRESPQTRGVPVIVLTAQILTGEDMALLQQGVAAVLGKEMFTPDEVLSQIGTALARAQRLGTDPQRIVRLTMAYIHEHYAEPITRANLGQHLGINERYLTRCFHQETGLPPITYLTRYRVKQARALLDNSTLSITEIALATGFSDSGYFCRVFQREVGVSPTAYRRGQRPAAER